MSNQLGGTRMSKNSKVILKGILLHPSRIRREKNVTFGDQHGGTLVTCHHVTPFNYGTIATISPSHHEKTSGKYISLRVNEQSVTWKLVEVEGAHRTKYTTTEAYCLEMERREQFGVSSAPLFGDFEAIDDVRVESKSSAKIPPIIPLVMTANTRDHQQASDSTKDLPPALQLMLNKLREKGFMSDTKHPTSLLIASDQSQPVLPVPGGRIVDPWTQSGWKINEPCTYFMFRANGCNRGETCRFVHDRGERGRRLIDRVNNRREMIRTATERVMRRGSRSRSPSIQGVGRGVY